MLKPVVAALMLSFAVPAMAADYQPNEWQQKALDLINQEPKVHDAIWNQAISVWVAVDDDGTDRRGYGEYVCILLNHAGKPVGEFVAITVVDYAAMLKGDFRQLGKAPCA